MRVSRRLFIAAAAAGAAMPLARLGAARSEDAFEWRGTALGADCRIAVAGLSQVQAEGAVRLARDEAYRLEQAFSLYVPGSELSRLNRDGYLRSPSQDFRMLLQASLAAHAASGGAFNPAIQPLWSYLARHFADHRDAPPEADIVRRLALCDASRIDCTPAAIRLAPGMALTFNGIAQGYITDAAAGILEAAGYSDILVDLGEIRALPGRAWSVAVAGSGERLDLRRRAVAQSAGSATRFTIDGRWHHLIDPVSGHSANRFRSVTITAGRAADADWLSTALYVAPQERHATILARVNGAAALLQSGQAQNL